jgi:hypothetical protein
MKNKDPQIIDIMPFIRKRKKEKEEKIFQEIEENFPDLADVAEILVNVSLILDTIGHFSYADKISDILAEIFEDDALKDDPDK